MTQQSFSPEGPTLRRSLSLPLLVLYGLGTTIGAGIYALTGEVARNAGLFAPGAFLLASLLATFTAFSFAEMSSRFPRSAGEAIYVMKGLRAAHLGHAVGFLVALAGCVSGATIVHGFLGYLATFTALPDPLVIAVLVLLLGLIAVWGITESVMLAALFTLVEIGGLLFVMVSARDSLLLLPDYPARLANEWSIATLTGILGASLVAFYAFLGFEDMVNVAEEVKRVRRTLPLAIILTLGVTAVLYVLLALVAILTVPVDELGASPAPLALVYERATGRHAGIISTIALFAMVNGALIQVIMASRVLYGLARVGALPPWLGGINRRTRTPLRATAAVTGLMMVLALWFPLARLAELTSTLTLVVFSLVNLALWVLKGREPAANGTFRVPRWIPFTGFVVSTCYVVYGIVRLSGSVS
ncbi:MAG: amino acid permease [Pseudomonadota bacterium]